MSDSRDGTSAGSRPGEPLDWDTVVSIDGYRVLGELGRGAMGVVLLAEQQSPKRQVALKVLRPDAMTPIRERRFELETESLAMLKHPGIAPVYAAGRVELEGQTYPYFAMELVQGESLDRYAKRIDRRLVLGKMISICEAVDAAHRRGILHRDLKPANILWIRAGGHASWTSAWRRSQAVTPICPIRWARWGT